MRSKRSASANAILAPESFSAYSSSAPVHHALSGVAIAPASSVPKNAAGHSGRLRIAMATRSPLRTPASISASARASAARHAGQEHVAQGRRRMLPDPRPHAVNELLLHLEARARRGEKRARLRNGHGGPRLCLGSGSGHGSSRLHAAAEAAAIGQWLSRSLFPPPLWGRDREGGRCPSRAGQKAP